MTLKTLWLQAADTASPAAHLHTNTVQGCFVFDRDLARDIFANFFTELCLSSNDVRPALVNLWWQFSCRPALPQIMHCVLAPIYEGGLFHEVQRRSRNVELLKW